MQILSGLDTEYGLLIEGRTAEDQIEDSMALVRHYAGKGHVGWNYRYESPRADLRGFSLKHLASDPEDAKYDRGRKYAEPHEVRADRILPNGARFYNDHGHPEYATPECLSLSELMLHDAAGDEVVRQAGLALQRATDRRVSIYKNNSDFHGASWGSHESYLVPRALGFEALFRDLLPMFVVRQVLCGAGKVGAESGTECVYQLSQRADFFVEPANAETLFRRPIFNTRDEPHSERNRFVRLHVICGDSNRIASALGRKVGLVKLALRLAENGTAPLWKIKDPVRAIQAISRDERYEFAVELEGKSWTTAHHIFESYFAAAESTLDLDEDERWTIESGRQLLSDLSLDWGRFCRRVDWAAKRRMLEELMADAGLSWRDPALRAYDMEYHNLDPDESLFGALIEMGAVEEPLDPAEVDRREVEIFEPTRARARSIAVRKFGDKLVTACWRSLTFDVEGSEKEVDLRPDVLYPEELEQCDSVEELMHRIGDLND